MASSDAARLLTEAHRLAQARIAAATVSGLRASWRLLDPANIDATLAAWLRTASLVVQSRRRQSATLSIGYLQAFRALELGNAAGFTPVLAADIDEALVTASLMVTGPVSIRAAVRRGRPVVEAAEKALVRVGGVGVRHTLGGGRDTIEATISADPRGLGYQRVTSGKPCAFCAMLAGRGPVYSAGTGGFRPHDACHCQPEPVYRQNTNWAPGARKFNAQWAQHTAGLTGDDALNAFRRALTPNAA